MCKTITTKNNTPVYTQLLGKVRACHASGELPHIVTGTTAYAHYLFAAVHDVITHI